MNRGFLGRDNGSYDPAWGLRSLYRRPTAPVTTAASRSEADDVTFLRRARDGVKLQRGVARELAKKGLLFIGVRRDWLTEAGRMFLAKHEAA